MFDLLKTRFHHALRRFRLMVSSEPCVKNNKCLLPRGAVRTAGCVRMLLGKNRRKILDRDIRAHEDVSRQFIGPIAS